MEPWQQSLANSLTRPAELAERFGIDPSLLEAVVRRYPMRITPHYLGLIREAGDPIWRQCVPDPVELRDEEAPEDPLHEENLSPVPGLVHRYPDRVLLLVSGACAVYCRFCTRKRKVGCGGMSASAGRNSAPDSTTSPAAPRFATSSSPGATPCFCPTKPWRLILARLRAIPHVEMIRIGSRVPVTLPERITESLCACWGATIPSTSTPTSTTPGS